MHNKPRRTRNKGVIEAGGIRDYKNINDFFCKRQKSNILGFMSGKISRENYKEIIQTKFVWIGLTEHLQTYIDQLAIKLGFAKLAVERLNMAERNEELSTDIRRKFIHDNQLEFEIYEYVKESLSKRSN